MFDKRTDLVRFLGVAEAGKIGLAADRLSMTQPALTRVIARLERQLGARLFERTPKGVRLTAFGAALVEPAQRVLREIETAQGRVDAARAGRAGRFRVTANPTWEAVLPHAIARFHERFPAVELDLETATRVEGLRLLAEGRSDLHCGGIDSGEALPTYLRRERFLDMTAGIVAWRGHPLLGREITDDDLARSPWIDYDAPAMVAPGERRPSLGSLLERLPRPRLDAGPEERVRRGPDRRRARRRPGVAWGTLTRRPNPRVFPAAIDRRARAARCPA